jgi:hypothetical protein
VQVLVWVLLGLLLAGLGQAHRPRLQLLPCLHQKVTTVGKRSEQSTPANNFRHSRRNV